MKQIKLRNFKNDFLIFGCLTLALAFIIIYWAINRNGTLSVSGANLDNQTSKILLLLISLGPLIACVNQFILYFSFKKYGEFVINLGAETIDYPCKKSFVGFQKIVIQKKDISAVKLLGLGSNQHIIQIYGNNNGVIANIPGDYAPFKIMKPNEMCAMIQDWVKS
jgi:hypothetical protein